jgi:hypothetical protein
MDDDVKHLHMSCISSLKEYMDEAQRTCDLLTSIESFPVSLEKQNQILQQRLSENETHERYQIAREHFFRALRPAR